MTTSRNNKTAKITEIILLSITLLLTLIPALLLLVMLLEVFQAEIPDRQWERALQMIGFSVPGLFGFVSLIIRINNILSNKTSKVAALGLLTGTLLFVLSFSPEFPQLFRRHDFTLLAAIFFPVLATAFSLRNIYRELQQKKHVQKH